MSHQHRSSRRRTYGRRQHEIREDRSRDRLWRIEMGPFWVLSASRGTATVEAVDAMAGPAAVEASEADATTVPTRMPVTTRCDSAAPATPDWGS